MEMQALIEICCMKRMFVLFVIAGVIALFSCNQSDSKNEKKSTRKLYLIKGSDTEYELVKNILSAFREFHELEYSIEGGGTLTGINALLHNQIDMAMASREMNEEEYKELRFNSIRSIPIMFATDAVAIITHPRLGVDSLSMDQLRNIFTGKVKNWDELGGPHREIHIYVRNGNSGTHSYFINKVLGSNKCEGALICGNTREIVEKVSVDSMAIGYCGAGFLMDSLGKPSNKIWAMPISIDPFHRAYSPYEVKEVKAGNYPLTRPLFQYFKQPISEDMKDFIKFELAQKGQQLVRRFGFFPISDYQKEINKVNGFE